MRKLIIIVLCLVSFSSSAQLGENQEIKLTVELESYLDNFTYQVVLFKNGTIIPVKESWDKIDQYAIQELQKMTDSEFGLDFAVQAYSPLDLDGVIVFDYQDIRNYVVNKDFKSAMVIAKENRKMDAAKPEIVYISN